MYPVLLPLLEAIGQRALAKMGGASTWCPTSRGLVHCYDVPGRGNLPTIVLLHGLAASATSFAPLMKRLVPHSRRIVAPDHLGHGFSSGKQRSLGAEDVRVATREAVLAMVSEPVLLVANSMGAVLAVEFATRYPELVCGLVLVSPAGAPFSEADWANVENAFDVADRRDAIAFFGRIYARLPWPLRLVAHELPDYFRRPALRALLAGSAAAAVVPPEELAGLTMPILVLWGNADRLLPRSHLGYFRKHLPTNTRFEEPPHFGHSPHLEATDRLAEYIIAFGNSVTR